LRTEENAGIKPCWTSEYVCEEYKAKQAKPEGVRHDAEMLELLSKAVVVGSEARKSSVQYGPIISMNNGKDVVAGNGLGKRGRQKTDSPATKKKRSAGVNVIKTANWKGIDPKASVTGESRDSVIVDEEGMPRAYAPMKQVEPEYLYPGHHRQDFLAATGLDATAPDFFKDEKNAGAECSTSGELKKVSWPVDVPKYQTQARPNGIPGMYIPNSQVCTVLSYLFRNRLCGALVCRLYHPHQLDSQ
jgi:hypothetical protein